VDPRNPSPKANMTVKMVTLTNRVMIRGMGKLRQNRTTNCQEMV
jgi:hypothetical protein